MELLLIDEAGIANATQDNEVVIIRHQGEIEITTEEMEEQLEIISYEVTCGISERVPPIHKKL